MTCSSVSNSSSSCCSVLPVFGQTTSVPTLPPAAARTAGSWPTDAVTQSFLCHEAHRQTATGPNPIRAVRYVRAFAPAKLALQCPSSTSSCSGSKPSMGSKTAAEFTIARVWRAVNRVVRHSRELRKLPAARNGLKPQSPQTSFALNLTVRPEP